MSELKQGRDWDEAARRLYAAHMVVSLKYAQEVTSEIKKRLTRNPAVEAGVLPDVRVLSELASTSIGSWSRAEIFFTYLYYSDSMVARLVQMVQEFFLAAGPSEPILHSTIKNAVGQVVRQAEKEGRGRSFSPKTLSIWVGKFISALKEIRFLIPQKRLAYLVNVGGISGKTWTFFLLWAHFRQQPLTLSPLTQVFGLQPEHIPVILRRLAPNNNIKYGNDTCLCRFGEIVSVETRFRNITEWLAEFHDRGYAA
ncbi:MAG: hypothetical protein Kow0069_21430 [Promethearchaeota archaeon]